MILQIFILQLEQSLQRKEGKKEGIKFFDSAIKMH